jgi:hypothetical protein
MRRIKAGNLLYIPLAGLIIFIIADGINIYNSGVYADAHGLAGDKVGWFAPYGMFVFLLSVLVTVGYGITLFSRLRNK